MGTSITSIAASDHTFLYSNGQMRDLGTLGGFGLTANVSSRGQDINNVGQIVGSSQTSPRSGSHAFLYSNGQMRDLNDLIDPTLGITLSTATAINDRGQIVANGPTGNSLEHAYLLTPIPEPSTLALFGVALLGLGVWVRRQPTLFR